MSAAENKAVVRRMCDAINEGGWHVLDQVLAPGYVGHFGGGRRHVRGREGLKQLLTAARGAFPDVRFAAEDVVAEGEKVAVRWTIRGTHRGDLMGVAPTGRPVTVTAIAIYRVVGGTITEQWGEEDAVGLLRQLGMTAAQLPSQKGTNGT